jgi:hypothetical protein
MGGLSKFTDRTRGAILGALRTGVSHEIAAEAAEISRMTLYRWLQQGAKDEDAGVDTEHARFMREFRQAEAFVLATVEQSLTRTAASGADWRAAAWVLSRRMPAVYSQDVTDALKERMAQEMLDHVRLKSEPEFYDRLLNLLTGE